MANRDEWADKKGHLELGARTLLDQRALALEGGPNFRDIGGLPGAGGKRVVAGRFYRGDELGRLTDADLAALAALPIRTVIDFRTVEEAENLPDRLPGSVMEYRHLPIVPGNLENAYRGGFPTPGALETFMFEVYGNLVTDPGILASYRRFFALLREDAALPVLFHCTAGKDRTGMAAAFLLLALGVDRDAVTDDYLASNICLARKYGGIVKARPHMAPGLFANRDYLSTSLAVIERDHGTVDAFLTRQLGIDLNELRAKHLA